MTLESFREQSRRKLSSVYSDFDLTVSLGKIRSIRIYLTGEVNRPGAYTVSSLTSLFNSLYLAGGPSDNGTMRNIKLMRNGKAVAVVDLYDFLLRGDNSLDVKLESGDAIFVPVTGPRAAIRGQVKRPAIYELKDGERMCDLLNLAGGATASAYLDRVMLERISAESEWEVVDLNLSQGLPEDSGNVLLADGDRITVYSIFDFKKNMVAVYGYVKHPGYYERNDSTRISSLIGRAQLQPYDVYYDRANLFRRYSDYRMEVIPVNIEKALAGDVSQDLLLQDRDSLHVYSVHDVTWDKYVSIAGEVKSPGTYPLYENMTARDLIFLAGSYNRSASRLQAELAHVDSLGDVSLEYVSLTDSALATTYLSEDDRVFIRQIPEWQLHRTVTLKGKVKYPGEYVLSSRNETLYELLQRAGGFAQNAFPQGLVFERETIGNNLERQRVPELVEKSSPIIQDSTGNLMRQMLFDYEPQSVNRIIIDMDGILATHGRNGDILLEPGDRIFVPAVPSGVTILGAVGANGTIKYTDRNSVKDYIERAGDFTPQADEKGTRLIRANGEVISGKHALGKKVELGDVIVVPTKIKREHDWGKTLTTVLTATTSVLTTVLIIDKL
jgi:protein involved in polysaccharide export with SLBB domain